MPREKMTDAATSSQIFLVGQMAGMCMKLRPDLIIEFLKSDPKGFLYRQECEAVLALHRELMQPRQPRAATDSGD